MAVQQLTKNNLAVHEAETWIENGYCTACRKTVTTSSLRAHLQSSTHKWRTGYMCREAAVHKHVQFLEGNGNLADYLPMLQQPVLEYFTHVTFRLLSGLAFAQFDVSSSVTGMLECQNNLAVLLQVHPRLIKIQYTGLHPVLIGKEAYICRSDFVDRSIASCSLCFCSGEVMTVCRSCEAYVCDVCFTCPEGSQEGHRCWGCMPISSAITPRDIARKLVIGHGRLS